MHFVYVEILTNTVQRIVSAVWFLFLENPRSFESTEKPQLNPCRVALSACCKPNDPKQLGWCLYDSEYLHVVWLCWQRIRMEGNNGHSSSKSIEKVLSRKVMQAGSSAPCKMWATGFLCGVCVVYLLGVALPPLRVLQSRSVYPPRRAILWNFTSTKHGNCCILLHI